jgi:acyl-[acyl-carrier-protein]-phospholipid O-acyltransferase/long-chain-fatty-acid--[acyl-carrier-protein] ligase
LDSLAAKLTASLDNKPENSGAVSQSATSLAGFWALIAVQFQNAFSDNALKWLVSFLVLETALTKQERDLWFVLVVPLLFAVPFLLFSIPGGYLADRYSKRTVAIGTKFFELIVMGLATFALSANRFDLAGAALFLACTQGAIFGPTKYALLPELLPESKLSWGNGIIELTTLLSAIFAALAGGFLATHFRGRQVWSGIIFLTLTIIGLLISLRITRVPAADPTRRFDWNVPREFFVETHRLWRDNVLRVAVLANTFFWFLGSLLLLNIVLYATDILHVDDQHSSYLLAALSLGIGIGSFLAGYASAGKIEHGMILPGMIGIMAMSALLASPGLSFLIVAILLALLGTAGGFFVVPVNALIQRLPAPEEKGRTIAVANLLSFVGVALQPLAQYGMLRQGHPDPSRVFLFAAAMTLLMGIVLIGMMPDLGARALDWTHLRSRATL